MTLIEVDPQAQAVQQTYEAVYDLLMTLDITKAVALTALLNIIGTQFAGEMSDDDAAVFVEQASQWLNGYFNGVV